MRIVIAERLRPFSHLPGASCMLPGTSLRVQAFPALLRICDLNAGRPKGLAEIELNLDGPVNNFTLQLDLEKPCVSVWGHALQGYFRYKILPAADKNSYIIVTDKNPLGPLSLFKGSVEKGAPAPAHHFQGERLSLGISKELDWQMAARRCNLAEVFPVWFRLGCVTPETKEGGEGAASLLDDCRKAINECDQGKAMQLFRAVYLCGFEGILSPRLNDDSYQGFKLPPVPEDCRTSPILLLNAGAALIRRLFIQVDRCCIAVLPVLPKEFHAGRFTNVRCGALGYLDMEWSKKQIRRMIFRSSYTGNIRFGFSGDVKFYRLRTSVRDKGESLSCKNPLAVKDGCTYFLDCFAK